MSSLKGRHFLSMLDLSGDEVRTVLDTARSLKETCRAARAEARGSGSETPVRASDKSGLHSARGAEMVGGAHPTDSQMVGGAHPPDSQMVGGAHPTDSETVGGAHPTDSQMVGGAHPTDSEMVGGAHPTALTGEHPFPGPLQGKTLAMIFQKPSLRTRVSFETGMTRLGGHAIYLGPSDISLGQRETTEDIALVLSRYVDIIMARVFGHEVVEELARHASVPVINGLSDFEHPCQVLADFQTILERKGRLEGVNTCYIGDGNNVAHSLMYGAARVGMNITVITPSGYEPQRKVIEQSTNIGRSTGSRITVTNDLSAAADADVLYTDVWASMGQESEAQARKKIFKPYRIDASTMKLAKPDAIILHCLPAHYGEEIDYETSRLPNSAIFDQAENRMHAQNALMIHLTK